MSDIADAAQELNLDREVLDEIVELLDDKGQVVLYDRREPARPTS